MCWQYVCDKLMEVYGIECSANNVLNLDSSTEEKFSQHLIFNLQNATFKDNIHVGTFRVASRQETIFFPYVTSLHTFCLFCFFLGRFIHAILQPVLNAPKSGSCLTVGRNSVAENSETWFVFQNCENKYFHFSAIITLCNFSRWCTDSRTHAVSEGKPARATEMAESPQTKRRKREEGDLGFLQVKNKGGQDCLFVDLGKKNLKLLFVLFYSYIRHMNLLGLNACLVIFSVHSAYLFL